MENISHCSSADQSPSVIQHSCPGSITTFAYLFVENSEQCITEHKLTCWKESCKHGGFTFCVPYCYSNSGRDKTLSFYRFPDGKSRERQLVKNIGFIRLLGKTLSQQKDTGYVQNTSLGVTYHTLIMPRH